MSEEKILMGIEREKGILEYFLNHGWITEWKNEDVEFRKNCIQGLLDLYNKEKEKNIELELQNIILEKDKEDIIKEINEKLISKDKIKEKIEELEEQLKYNLFKNHEIYTVVENKLLHKIEVLEELLKGE